MQTEYFLALHQTTVTETTNVDMVFVEKLQTLDVLLEVSTAHPH